MAKPLTPEEFEAKMAELLSSDYERAHGEMDDLLITLLRSLGYGAGCDIFEQQDKWYA